MKVENCLLRYVLQMKYLDITVEESMSFLLNGASVLGHTAESNFIRRQLLAPQQVVLFTIVPAYRTVSTEVLQMIVFERIREWRRLSSNNVEVNPKIYNKREQVSTFFVADHGPFNEKLFALDLKDK